MTELRTVGDAEVKFVREHYWDPQLKKPTNWKIHVLQQVKPSKEQINQFEQTRTDYERRLAGQKLKTVYCYFGANETTIKNILKNGFKATFGSQPVTLWVDPVDAINFATDKQILLCRVALGRSGDFGDHTFDAQHGKYTFKDPSAVIPAWLIYVA